MSCLDTGAGCADLVATDEPVSADDAWADFRPVVPMMNLNPGPRLGTLAGLPVWIWADAAQWRPITVSRTVGRAAVSLVVTPEQISVSSDEPGASPVTCAPGPGTPWAAQVAPHQPSPSCGYVPHRAGRQRITITVAWHGSYQSVVDGRLSTGDLGRRYPQTVVEIVVGEAQAVIQ